MAHDLGLGMPLFAVEAHLSGVRYAIAGREKYAIV